MKSLSMELLLSGRSVGDPSHPIPPGSVVDLGLGTELFEQPEAFAFLGGACGGAPRIVQIAELDGACRARFHAGGNVIGGVEFLLASCCRALPCRMPSAVTKVAFLHHSAHARGDVGIERFLHAR